jgi:hypothetical protein
MSTDRLNSQAGLFAGFLSVFLIELLKGLKQDPMDIIQDVLIHQTLMMRNASVGPYVASTFSPPGRIVAVNALLFASLGFVLLAAFVAMLIKSWISEFDRDLKVIPVPEHRAKTHAFRYQGLLRWHLPTMVATLPILMQVSLLSFSIGLALFLSDFSMWSCGAITFLLGIGVLFYIVTTLISVFVPASPFRSLLSQGLGVLYQQILSKVLPTVEDLMSHEMDHSPATWFVSQKRQLQHLLYRFQPYSEENFVKPFGDCPEDPMQLKYAAIALEWLHNNLSGSQESRHIYWTVWHVAGSAVFRAAPKLKMPQWIMDCYHDINNDTCGDFSLPPTELCTLTSVRMRSINTKEYSRNTSYLLNKNLVAPWDKLVAGVDSLVHQGAFFSKTNSNSIVNIILPNEYSTDGLLWLVDTISQFWLSGALHMHEPQGFIDICHSILFCFIREKRRGEIPQVKGILLLNAVVTLAAIVLLPKNDDSLESICTGQKDSPWLLSSLRSPELLERMVGSAHSKEVLHSANQLFFLLFLLFLRRNSFVLASQYFDIIVRDDSFSHWTSMLAKHALHMGGSEIILVIRLLMTEKTQRLQLYVDTAIDYPVVHGTDIQDVLQRYDEQLEDSEDPDPAFLGAILSIDPKNIQNEEGVQPQLLKNSWCVLAAQAITKREISDQYFQFQADHTLPSLITAAVLRGCDWYDFAKGGGFRFLASSLQFHEFRIVQKAFWNYIVVMGDSALPPPEHLSNAVQIIFNHHLTLPELVEGWNILQKMLSQWELIQPKWQQAFARSFLPRTYRQLPQLREDLPIHTGLASLQRVFTWEYIQAMKDTPQIEDCSGIDWFKKLSTITKESVKNGEAPKLPLGAKKQDLETVTLSLPAALEKLVLATPIEVLIPLVPEIKEFISEFGMADAPHADTFKRILSSINERAHWQQFFCALYFD